MNLSQIKDESYSISYNENGNSYSIDFSLNKALGLLDQIIEKETENDKNFKKDKSNSPMVKDWEQSVGESWTLFHLKTLKNLLQ